MSGASYSWNGQIGYYDDPSQWTPERVPGPSDQAEIAAGEVNADGLTIRDVAIGLGSTDFNNPAQLDLHYATLGDGTVVTTDGRSADADATLLGDYTNDGTVLTAGANAHLVTVNDPTGTTTNNGLIDQDGGELGLGQGGGGLGDLDDSSSGVIAATGGGNSGAGGTLLELGYDNVVLNGMADAIGARSDLFITTSYSITGTGTVTLGAGGNVDVETQYVAGPTFKFDDGAGSEHRLFAGNTFASDVVDFQQGDTIGLTFGSVDQASWSNGVLTLSENGTFVQAISLTSSTIDYSQMTFTATQNGLTALVTVAPTDAPEPVVPVNAAPVSYSWNGGSGDFNDASQWTPSGVPGNGDMATIDSGDVDADGLTISGVTINLASTDFNNPSTLELHASTIGAGTTITTDGTQAEADATLDGAFTNDGTIRTFGGSAHLVAVPDPAGTTTYNSGLISAGGGELGLGEGGGAGDFDNTGTGVIAATGGSLFELGYDNAVLDGTAYAYGSGSTLSISTSNSVTGTGTVHIGAGGQVADVALDTDGPTFKFDDGAGDTLRMGFFVPTTFASDVQDFQQGDQIILSFTAADQASWSDGLLTVSEDGSVVQTISLTSDTIDYSQMTFTATNSGGSFPTTEITVMPCFAAGTSIATPTGAVPVESLRAGSDVVTANGAVQTVTWVGHRHLSCLHHPEPTRVLPICVTAGAFAEACPSRDLFLSPDHAIFAGGVLIPVKHLVNGTTIRQVRVENVTYYHVELKQQDVVLAEGLPCESYLDTGDRKAFAGGIAIELHPAWGSEARDVTLVMDALGYAPLRVAGPEVDGVRAQLSKRAREGITETAIASKRQRNFSSEAQHPQRSKVNTLQARRGC